MKKSSSRVFITLILPILAAVLLILLAALLCRICRCSPDNPQTRHESETEASTEAESVSFIGTWVEVDDWERGYSAGQYIIEFREDGTIFKREQDSVLYYYADDSALYVRETEDGDYQQQDIYVYGDYLEVHGSDSLLSVRHRHTSFVRISEQTGLTEYQLDEIY